MNEKRPGSNSNLLSLVPLFGVGAALSLLSFVNLHLTIFVAFFYLLFIVYIYMYIKNEMGGLWTLPISFAISPVPVILHDLMNPGVLQFGLTWIVVIYYAIPFVLITVIVAIVIKRKSKNRRLK